MDTGDAFKGNTCLPSVSAGPWRLDSALVLQEGSEEGEELGSLGWGQSKRGCMPRGKQGSGSLFTKYHEEEGGSAFGLSPS